MKPARIFKKLGAAAAVGLIALGIIAGTTSAAAAAGTSGEAGSYSTSTSGEAG